MKIFISGPPKSGKSTLVTRTISVLKNRGLKVGGIITPEVKRDGKRIGFRVRDILTGREGWLASTTGRGIPFGRYIVHVGEFEEIAIPALESALKSCDIIVVDEVGKMEFLSEKFKEILYTLLNSEKPLLITLHRNYVKKFKSYGKIYWLTPSSRNEIFKQVLNQLLLSR